MEKRNIAIFASGTGSNAVNLIQYFQGHPSIEVALLLCNKADAPVILKAQALGIETFVCTNEAFESGLTVLQELDYRNISWIVLAGFLRKIPVNLIRGYQNKIINIHPALLPKYGGKGMYGQHVHQAVFDAKEKESGISIHFVNEVYDDGKIIAQFRTDIDTNDTPESIGLKIQQLEAAHFPYIVEQTIVNS